MQTETIKLDGREFRGVTQELTAAQDDYLIAHLRLAGALEIVAEIEKAPEKKSEELLTRILLSGRTHSILAGVLTEIGKDWTREEADRNAKIFSRLTSPTDKIQMRTAIVAFVLGFFTLGQASEPTSPSSSSPIDTELRIANAAPGISETSPS